MLTKKDQQKDDATKEIIAIVSRYGFTGVEALELFNRLVIAQQASLAHLLRAKNDKEKNDGSVK